MPRLEKILLTCYPVLKMAQAIYHVLPRGFEVSNMSYTHECSGKESGKNQNVIL